MMCRHCGAPVEERAPACTECGAVVGKSFERGPRLPRHDVEEARSPSAVAKALPTALPIGGALLLLALQLVIENLGYAAFIVLDGGLIHDPRLVDLVLWMHASAVFCLVTTVAFFMRLRVARLLLVLHFGGALLLALFNRLFGLGISGLDAGLCGAFWAVYVVMAGRARQTFVVGLG